MKIAMQSPGIRVSRKLTQEFQTRFSHVEKLLPGIIRCDILLKKDQDIEEPCLVEARLSVTGNDLFAIHRAPSFELAAGKVLDALEKQIQKHKSRFGNKRSAKAIDLVMGEWIDEENS